MASLAAQVSNSDCFKANFTTLHIVADAILILAVRDGASQAAARFLLQQRFQPFWNALHSEEGEHTLDAASYRLSWPHQQLKSCDRISAAASAK